MAKLKWTSLRAVVKKRARQRTPLELLGDTFPASDAATAEYLQDRYRPLLEYAVGSNGRIPAERLRLELEAELHRLAPNGHAGDASHAIALSYILAAKGHKRALQVFRKWQNLRPTDIGPKSYSTMLGGFSGQISGRKAFLQECYENGCVSSDAEFIGAQLRSLAGRGVDETLTVLERMKGDGVVVSVPLLGWALRTARHPTEAGKVAAACGLRSAALMADPHIVSALAASATSTRHAHTLLERWTHLTEQPLTRDWWHNLANAAFKDGHRNGWTTEHWKALYDVHERAQHTRHIDTTLAHIVLSGLYEAILVRIKKEDSEAKEILRAIETLFKSTLERKQGADGRVWTIMFKVYSACRLPKRSLALGTLNGAQWHARPTKTLLASFVESTKGLPLPKGELKEDEGELARLKKIRWIPIKEAWRKPVGEGGLGGGAVRQSPQYALRLPSLSDPPQKGFLPWVPGQRPR